MILKSRDHLLYKNITSLKYTSSYTLNFNFFNYNILKNFNITKNEFKIFCQIWLQFSYKKYYKCNFKKLNEYKNYVFINNNNNTVFVCQSKNSNNGMLSPFLVVFNLTHKQYFRYFKILFYFYNYNLYFLNYFYNNFNNFNAVINDSRFTHPTNTLKLAYNIRFNLSKNLTNYNWKLL